MNLLGIVESVNSFTYGEKPNDLYILRSHDGKQPLGYVVPDVAKELNKFPNVFQVDDDLVQIKISSNLDTIEKRNRGFKEVADSLNESGFIKGWRNELFIIHYPAHEPYVYLERAFSPLLGIVMYGIHANCYIPKELSSTGEIQFWIPRRSKTKSTHPGMLDNTVGGGLGHPFGVFDTLIKESEEEAGLERSFVKKNAKAVGTVSYTLCDKQFNYGYELGLIQPEVQYIYDIPCDESIVPKPNDNEVECFHLMSFEEVWTNLLDEQFKPSCALVIIDFLTRHGFVNSENEPDYVEILAKLHRLPPFPLR
ncbi:Nudix hydrolase [Wickerhamomyces ciferrii]|uniref:Nudix hydrolase n=1 Tax=Wickerhamomyces ciferrii (strain ATCC 14091 / BCRC 22168 / CBS 111 / JCM 3599 / NBRC 0793 / NRRL Y-1031 F-60-10) TaxID=1206466 RepID=K0KMF3_WICCF|nr:Nudix hydrolase [Wickerhamomyces ciferrii]CCH42559.1 Nudix hydrolase [Wickerhamomyces ciferrii]